MTETSFCGCRVASVFLMRLGNSLATLIAVWACNLFSPLRLLWTGGEATALSIRPLNVRHPSVRPLSVCPPGVCPLGIHPMTTLPLSIWPIRLSLTSLPRDPSPHLLHIDTAPS